ncbi:N-acyl-D-amino-acid deacylase [Thermocatellispora tengchongensis]|uniref:N-acyl-D-amino-acid deacylase n=1 Tax=Thermocatellispora tengchongensis TaxID=1073253 RepID=A0A840NTS6_9ACTN|nr:serine hydrolase domain-containing protein [Thermocatellispora tengchongensis]MBB5132134.1 N-acyl-D-amino-acid deacylase [Thermocatellispora tengchongensis]
MLTRRNVLMGAAALAPAVALDARPAAARAGAPALSVTGVAPSQLAPLDDVLKTYIKEREISCAQLAVTKNGKLVLARGYRYTDDASIPAVQPTSLFRIASLSKNITAAAVLKLAQDGQVSLGTPITTLLDLPTEGDARLRNVTLWRLMQHTGGWDREISKDYLWLDRTISKELGVPLPIGHQQIIEYAGARPLDFTPGSRMAYSNYGYMLLGRVVERVSGRSYESYVKEKLLAPAGITRMRLGRSLRSQAARGEVPYFSLYTTTMVMDASGATVPYPYGGFNMPNQDANGGWLASAPDLVRWARVFDAPSSILSSLSISRAFAKPEIGVNEHGSWYGCGWWVRQVPGHLNTWHSGSMPGTYTYMARLQNGVTYAALFNRREEEGTPDYDVLSSRVNTALGQISAWPTTDLWSRYF